ncbi:MAG: tRNA lysidine(34) synthetase TilS [Acidimicrobiaceae bacterium]|nr:tRNA lysidine(34) synthetase TilS [Acidimicrobiaceae bacterium]
MSSITELLTRCRFPARGSHVSCGLSGGPDSSALVALAVTAGLHVTAWHVNHKLRPSADDDETVASGVASRLGADFKVRTVFLESGPHLEERARIARYAALPDDVMVGHTADDRAETVLFNIGRGGGLAGAATQFKFISRPLLGLRREETHAVCAQLDLEVVSDPMNTDETFSRVAIRTQVIPALARALGRDPVPLINRHADLASEAYDALKELAKQIDPASTAELLAVPKAVASEALRSWISTSTASNLGAVSAASIDRVLAVAAGRWVATEVTGGYRVSRRSGRLCISGIA